MTTGDFGLPQRYLHVLRRRAVPALIVAAVVVAAILAYTLRQSPVYQATSVVLINRQQIDLADSVGGEPSSLSEANDNGRLADTEVGIARSPAVAAATIRQLGFTDTSVAQLQSRVSVEATATDDLLTFTASGQSGPSAEALANAYVAQYLAYDRHVNTQAATSAEAAVGRLLATARKAHAAADVVSGLQSRERQLALLGALHTADVQIVSSAVTATRVRPKQLEDVLLAVVAALILGVVAAFVLEALDTRMRSGNEAAEILGLPILARVPRLRRRERARLRGEPTPAVAEAFRMLRARLDLTHDGQVSPLLVTSAVALEGKSMVAANLALSMARAGHNVALVDLDARQPTVATRFSLGAAPGLTSIAAGHVALDEAIVQYDVSEGIARRLADDEATMPGFRMLVLPLGPPPKQPGEFVHSGAVAAILADLQQRTDCVIIDSPPILGVSDPLVLSRLAGAVLFVTRPDRVTRQILHESHSVLVSMAAVVLGIVINGVDGRGDEAYRHVYAPTEVSA